MRKTWRGRTSALVVALLLGCLLVSHPVNAHPHLEQVVLSDDEGRQPGPAYPRYVTLDQEVLRAQSGWNVPTARSNRQRPIKNPPGRNTTLLPLVFEPLPLGSIKPLGWLRDQFELMADGLPGRQHEFYRLVKENVWLGGEKEYSPLNEGFPYWFNGLVPLAYGLDDDRLKKEVLNAAEYVISHQHEDGWIGPEDDLRQRNFWARSPFLLGMVQLIEAEPALSQAGAAIPAIHRFIDLMHEMLANKHEGFVWRPGDQFDEQWGRSRAADLIQVLQWLYEQYPGNKAEKIHDCMMYLYEEAYDWSYWFSEDVFIKADLDLLPVQVTRSLFTYVHGVNAGQGLKSGAVMRRLIHDDNLLNSTKNGVDWTFKYHGTPSGGIIGDEREAGLSPVRGTELCSVVETMYSLSYLYHALGDRDFADRCELTAFNALPVMVMPMWWAHQYVAQTNQPVSHRLPKPPFWNVGPEGHIFGTEPNYPCCTVDHPQGYPKFLSASFVRAGHDGIAHALLGPAEVSTKTKNGHSVRIRCETNYPFSNILEYHIKASGPFKFSFRVPSWTVLEESRVWLNGHKGEYLQPDNVTGMHTIILRKGRSTVEVELGAKIRVESRANDTVSIYHGALLYAVQVAGSYSAQRPARYPGFAAPPEANDWTILPVSPWNLAIDTSTLFFYEYPNREDEHLPNPIWQENAPPVSISVLACEIDWKLVDGYAPNPPLVGRRNCTGRAFPIELKPYGSAKLHMAELPTVNLRPGSPDLFDPGEDIQLLKNYKQGGGWQSEI